MDILVRIKRCALSGRVLATDKARDEMYYDDLTLTDVREALLNATAIYKTLRSQNPQTGQPERLYIIRSTNLSGVPVYTKGKLTKQDDIEVFYLLVSSKRGL